MNECSVFVITRLANLRHSSFANMDLQHINAKLFVEGEFAVPFERLIETFHGWVANQSLGEMLVDVADYRHVPHGPGVVIVGLESDWSLDHTDGRYGLRYNRKASLAGTNDTRFAHSLRQAAKVAALLEEKFADLKFSRSEFELFVNDRALAPHTPDGVAGFKTALASFFKNTLGQDKSDATYPSDPRSLVGAVVRLSAPVDLTAATAETAQRAWNK
jgi:hypothetical protein